MVVEVLAAACRAPFQAGVLSGGRTGWTRLAYGFVRFWRISCSSCVAEVMLLRRVPAAGTGALEAGGWRGGWQIVVVCTPASRQAAEGGTHCVPACWLQTEIGLSEEGGRAGEVWVWEWLVVGGDEVWVREWLIVGGEADEVCVRDWVIAEGDGGEAWVQASVSGGGSGGDTRVWAWQVVGGNAWVQAWQLAGGGGGEGGDTWVCAS